MYVVTGATGNTGKVVAEQLLSQGKKVRAIGRHADKLQVLAAKGAEPFVAELTDREALTRALSGAEAVYAMIPPNVTTTDVIGYRDQVIAAFVAAIEKNNIKHAVVLSSVGADKSEKTGPVIGLHKFEETLKKIPRLNALFLRAGYFMENTLGQTGIIRSIGKAAGPVRPDLKLPFIATSDIGRAAADALLQTDFSGQQTRELLGQRDLDYKEATAIIGKAIGNPGLEYIQLPNEQLRRALQQMGMSGNFIDLLLEMAGSLNSGFMRALEKRTPQNSTPTSFENFVADTFVPLYKGHSQAA
ncbi:MAG TPA: NAD(P)H-binding protein [Candidatus Angelobacter sp.]|nr:NAD(P)H-binding protein [Candidatus Angelobacter sp.]